MFYIQIGIVTLVIFFKIYCHVVLSFLVVSAICFPVMVKDSVASLKMFSDEEQTPPLEDEFLPSFEDPPYDPGYGMFVLYTEKCDIRFISTIFCTVHSAMYTERCDIYYLQYIPNFFRKSGQKRCIFDNNAEFTKILLCWGI